MNGSDREGGPADGEAQARHRMVEEQLEARGIRDRRVLDAMWTLPRHHFVDEDLRSRAYGDHALPTLEGQTISQPFMVARMLEVARLEPAHRVLEVGTGTGYQTALLAALVHHVWTIERHAPLLEEARRRLAALGIANVSFRVGDGSLGWQDFSPYDRVLVAAAAPRVPDALRAQLAERGLLVIPVGGSQLQHLETWQRAADGRWEHHDHGECRFVPLVGHDAWREERDET